MRPNGDEIKARAGNSRGHAGANLRSVKVLIPVSLQVRRKRDALTIFRYVRVAVRVTNPFLYGLRPLTAIGRAASAADEQ